MLQDFVFSVEGFSFLQNFKDTFDCAFRIDEPSGDALILDAGEHSYKIKDDESIEEFKAAVAESLETGKNLLVGRYKDSEIKYNEDADY